VIVLCESCYSGYKYSADSYIKHDDDYDYGYDKVYLKSSLSLKLTVLLN
jgi:hypothetical protein